MSFLSTNSKKKNVLAHDLTIQIKWTDASKNQHPPNHAAPAIPGDRSYMP